MGKTHFARVFAGSQLVTIDDKGRLAIPARFRQLLSDKYGSQLWITMGHQTCLELYPAPEFQRVADQILQLEDQDDAELLKLAFIGRAVETEIDKQGRVILPPLLRRDARLNGAAIVAGQINRIDVWGEEQWTAMFGDGPDSVRPSLRNAFRKLKR